MTEEAPNWRGALDVLLAAAAAAKKHNEAGDEVGVARAVSQLLEVDHFVLRLACCPDMADVYGALDIIGACKGQATRMKDIKRSVKSERSKRTEGGARGSVAIPVVVCLGEAAEGADIPEGVLVPAGYQMDAMGVYRGVGGEPDVIASAPILVSAVYDDVETGAANVRLSWMYRGDWVHRVVERETAACARKIVSLAKFKAPVSSLTASAVVGYLAAQESMSPGLPVLKSTTHQGWHGSGGSLGFVLGEKSRGPGRVEVMLSAADIEGPARLMKGFRQSGSLQEWSAGADVLSGCPRAMVGLGAAACAPLLGILPDARSFVLDVSAESGWGKTSAMRFWESLWGDYRTLELTWDATAVALERAAGFMRHLPIFVDDTKQAKDEARVTSWIYDVCAVNGRARGTVGSFKMGATTRTIGIITGERPAVTMGDFGHQGAHARVLTLRGRQAVSGYAAEKLERVAMRNFGVGGAALIDHLTDLRANDGWKSLRAYHLDIEDKYRDHLAAEVTGDMARVGRRAAPYLAMIHHGLKLLDDCGATSFGAVKRKAAMKEALNAAVRGVGAADLPTAAMEHLMQWASLNRERFYTPGRHDEKHVSYQKACGLWDGDEEYRVHIATSVAEEVVGAKYDWPAIYEAWKRTGVLEQHGKKKRWTRPRVVGPGTKATRPQSTCITFTKDAWKGALSLSDVETPDI